MCIFPLTQSLGNHCHQSPTMNVTFDLTNTGEIMQYLFFCDQFYSTQPNVLQVHNVFSGWCDSLLF